MQLNIYNPFNENLIRKHQITLCYICKDSPYVASYSEMQVYQQLDIAYSASMCSMDEHFSTAAAQNLSNFSPAEPGVVSLSLQFILRALQLNLIY